MIKAVFFDIGNTLVNFHSEAISEQRKKILLEFLLQEGQNMTAQQIEKLIAEANDYVEKNYFGSVAKYSFGIGGLFFLFQKLRLEVDKKTFDTLEERVWDVCLHGAKLERHAKEILSSLKSNGYKLAVVSNWTTQRANQTIDAFDLRRFFDLIVISEDVGAEKSSTIPFKVALEELGLKPEEVVMVGDRDDEDIFGAKMLGMETVKINRSSQVFGETRKADYEIDDLIELKEILKLDKHKTN